MATAYSENVLPGMSSQLKKRLTETTHIRDVAPRWSNIYIAKTSETISSVFKTLIDNSILSVPLLDVNTQKYVAFIDIFDILAYVVEVLNLPIESSDTWIMSSQFQNTSCIVLPNRSQRNPWQIISEDAPLQSAINMISQSGGHRLAVIDSFGRFSSVITQSRIVRFLAFRNMELGELGDVTIDGLSIVSKDLVTINGTEKLVDAFLKIYTHDISAVGVVDTNGKIIGNVSVTDFKDIGFSAGMFKKLFITIDKFLDRKIEGQNIPKLVWAYKTTHLNDVLYKLRSNRVHRVYILDENDEPYGVITLTDILNLFNSLLQTIGQR